MSDFKYLEGIDLLTKAGLNIIQVIIPIDDNVREVHTYVMEKFEPAQGLSNEHFLKGRDISRLLEQHRSSLTGNYSNMKNQLDTLMSEIDKLDVVQRRYHKDILYITYTNY